MTVNHSLGSVVGSRVRLAKAKAVVKQVEDQPKFTQVKALIQQIMSAIHPALEPNKGKARYSAILMTMQGKPQFELAVSQALNAANQNGQL